MYSSSTSSWAPLSSSSPQSLPFHNLQQSSEESQQTSVLAAVLRLAVFALEATQELVSPSFSQFSGSSHVASWYLLNSFSPWSSPQASQPASLSSLLQCCDGCRQRTPNLSSVRWNSDESWRTSLQWTITVHVYFSTQFISVRWTNWIVNYKRQGIVPCSFHANKTHFHVKALHQASPW